MYRERIPLPRNILDRSRSGALGLAFHRRLLKLGSSAALDMGSLLQDALDGKRCVLLSLTRVIVATQCCALSSKFWRAGRSVDFPSSPRPEKRARGSSPAGEGAEDASEYGLFCRLLKQGGLGVATSSSGDCEQEGSGAAGTPPTFVIAGACSASVCQVPPLRRLLMCIGLSCTNLNLCVRCSTFRTNYNSGPRATASSWAWRSTWTTQNASRPACCP